MDDIRRLLESFDRFDHDEKTDSIPLANSESDLEESLTNEYETFLSEQAAARRGAGALFGSIEKELGAGAAKSAGRVVRPRFLTPGEVESELARIGARTPVSQASRASPKVTPPTRAGKRGKEHSRPDEKPAKKEKGDRAELERPQPRASEPKADMPAVVRRPQRGPAAVEPPEATLPPVGGRRVDVTGLPSVVRTRGTRDISVPSTKPKVGSETPASPSRVDLPGEPPLRRAGQETVAVPTPRMRPEPATRVKPEESPVAAPERDLAPSPTRDIQAPAPRRTGTAPAVRPEPSPAARPEAAPRVEPSPVRRPGEIPEPVTSPTVGPRTQPETSRAGSIRPTPSLAPRLAAGAGLGALPSGTEPPVGGSPVPPGPVAAPIPPMVSTDDQKPKTPEKPPAPEADKTSAYPDLPEIDVEPTAPMAKLDLTQEPAPAKTTEPPVSKAPTITMPTISPGMARTAATTQVPGPTVPAEPEKGSFVRVRTPAEIAAGATQGSGYLRSRFSDRVRTGTPQESKSRKNPVIESLKKEFQEYVLDEAQVLNFPRTPVQSTVSAAPPAKSTPPAPRTTAQAPAPTPAATAQKAGTQFKSELGSRWNKGFSALGAYDEFTRRRDQPMLKRLAGGAIVGAGELLGTAAGAAAGGLTSPVTGPVGPVVGGIYGATKGYETGQAISDRLLGSPGAEAEGDVTKAIGKVAAPVGSAIGKGIEKAKASPLFKRDDQSYL